MASSHSPLRVMISAGELSGDEHASHVARALRELMPECELRGMGGRNLRAAGVETIVDSEKSASVMGFQELIGSLHKLLRAMRALRTLIVDWKPDVLIVTDFPDFHIRLAKFAHARGVRTLFYIPPKVWAWREGRARKIGAIFDRIAAIFPFEPQFYARFGVRHVTYVGHPMTSQINPAPLLAHRRDALLSELALPSGARIIAIFPGSRRFEIERHLPTMARAVMLLHERDPHVCGVVSVASSISPELIARYLPRSPALRTFSGNSVELLKLSECAALKSGTSNLQAAFCGIPFVMCYWVTRAFEIFIVPLLKLREFSPVNIIRSGTVRELLQREFNPETLAQELASLMLESEKRGEVIRGLQEVVAALTPPIDISGEPLGSAHPSVAERVATMVVDLAKAQR